MPGTLGAAAAVLSIALGGEAPPALTAVRVDTAPIIDGRIGADEWAGVEPQELRFQIQPGDNVAASQRTEVRVAYDRSRLYLAVRAWDSNAAGIRGRVARRDDISADDYIAVYLDTHNDRRRAYVFLFNPLGIQGDGLYNEGTSIGRDFDANIDRAWDGVFESQGTVDAEGYTIEAAIPFTSLRYDASGAWGLHVQRRIARSAETTSWRPISRDVPSLLTQMGTLGGLTGIGGGRSVSVIPTLTAANGVDYRAAHGPLRSRDADVGVTASWSPAPHLSIGATINPDFSQIEADLPQIEVNQRFPLRYAEKRPFFLDGGQFFRSPGAMNFLETRQIVDPSWGAKITGKSGAHTYAALAASDEAPGRAALPGASGHGESALFAVGRYQRDILENSTVGGFLATRRFAGDHNTVAALDGQFRLPGQTIGYQAAVSFTDTSSGSRRGDATYVWYDFVGRHWRLFLNDHRISPDYRADATFVRRRGFAANSLTFGYEFQGENTWWVRARPFLVARVLRLPGGALDESYADPGIDVTFVRNVTLYAFRSFHRNTFQGQTFDRQFTSMTWSVRAFKRIGGRARVVIGEDVHYNPANPQLADALTLDGGLTWKPDARLVSEAYYLKSRLRERGTGRSLVGQDIIGSRTSYQLTRAHAARAIVDYNTFTRRLGLNLLYTFLPRPNTAVYVGYGDTRLADRDPVTGRPEDGYQRERGTLFLKLSHDFRR